MSPPTLLGTSNEIFFPSHQHLPFRWYDLAARANIEAEADLNEDFKEGSFSNLGSLRRFRISMGDLTGDSSLL
jgi:hypothetical protein